MRITQETDDSLRHYRMQAFLTNAIRYLQQNYAEVIALRGITEAHLEQGVRQSYQWTVEQHRPSQLLALRVATARLCFGAFFMQDPRYAALQQIIHTQVATLRLTVEDPVLDYIELHQADKQPDEWQKNRSTLIGWIHTHQQNSRGAPGWLAGEAILHRLLEQETRTACRLAPAQYPAFIAQIKAIVAQHLPVTRDSDAAVLLAIGQYYDGLYCFDDPFRPRWFNALLGSHDATKCERIQRAFALTI
ncbi:hypothetical protein [Serratia microhaemolytica]|uniref:hypothetical protein n=1 Tax=Serratia microhaemolytica TaxID=2675110 RepID=UPI000FDE8DC5|nr:hypothetical protein [Serratia microhaemolytica]